MLTDADTLPTFTLPQVYKIRARCQSVLEKKSMTPEISEFSYGFALTHEFVSGFGGLRAAPIFPSLIEEGKAGGGYDVHLDVPGLPLYLQFKRADCMIRHQAKEFREGHISTLPYYRFKITERSRSAQHELLLDLDDGLNVVFYVAPRFHTVSDLDAAYTTGTVRGRSFFIRPRDIGALNDDVHHVAFSESSHVVCSEPRTTKAYLGEEVADLLLEKLSSDRRPLRSGPLADALGRIEEIIEHHHISTAVEHEIFDGERRLRSRLSTVDASGMKSEPRTHEEEQLRLLADRALRAFNTQLFIVQRATG